MHSWYIILKQTKPLCSNPGIVLTSYQVLGLWNSSYLLFYSNVPSTDIPLYLLRLSVRLKTLHNRAGFLSFGLLSVQHHGHLLFHKHFCGSAPLCSQYQENLPYALLTSAHGEMVQPAMLHDLICG
jgi:hypothetical protein